MLVTDVTGRE